MSEHDPGGPYLAGIPPAKTNPTGDTGEKTGKHSTEATLVDPIRRPQAKESTAPQGGKTIAGRGGYENQQQNMKGKDILKEKEPRERSVVSILEKGVPADKQNGGPKANLRKTQAMLTGVH
ncbi:hypothetical protein QJS10_CPB14g01040 [Acorus calamus]|uniref:Dehydrin n=1 Tax=Acorus calamus TaxID=4465 RepID=A0AAV9DAL7_ACOCL|nr:hypothetical protein QJS10_CPB14g01040 [Acorus calamus]